MTDSLPHRRAIPNRLASETSPYLLQHAYNPVDWYPWGEEALSTARTLDRPIFLSIGYSACHWCHVMEHESFENEAIADFMNQNFVCIKVDREERPDLDQIYMNAVQLITRHGGWPMSVFLTPDLKPFFGGTYWPPSSNRGMPGFDDVLLKVRQAWRDRRDDILRGAEELTDAVQQMAQASRDRSPLNDGLSRNAMERLISIADRHNGGFGGAPKFPHAMDLRVLLRGWKRFASEEALTVTRLTLDKMSQGGIYDHLGGGFHRYSTDEQWLVPHFEKMLYDNALLVPAYVEAFQATGDSNYARVARETLDYVLREMTQPAGGFYSTQDADSEGHEGKFFVWREREIEAVLGREDARSFNLCYDVTTGGNWEGHTILNRKQPLAVAAMALGIAPDVLAATLERCKAKLFAARAERIAPGRDDKVLTNWNGMMISAMALAAQVLEEPRYERAAAAAADFVLGTMRTADGLLLHSFKDDQARFNGYLDDYACFIDGLVEVYQAGFQVKYLEAAVELAGHMLDLFYDPEHAGFFYTSSNHEALIARNKECQDGSTPSGNSMAATALLRLGRLVGRRDLEEKGVKTLEFMSSMLNEFPMAAGQALLALDFLLGPTREIVIVDGDVPEETGEVLRTVHRRFLANKVIARRTRDVQEDAIPQILRPLFAGKKSRKQGATVFICQHGACGLPVLGAAAVDAALKD